MPSPNAPPSPEQQEKKMQEALLKQGMLAPGVLVSADGAVALMQIQFTEQVEDLPSGVIEDVVAIASDHADTAGLTALPTESLKPHEPPWVAMKRSGYSSRASCCFLRLVHFARRVCRW